MAAVGGLFKSSSYYKSLGQMGQMGLVFRVNGLTEILLGGITRKLMSICPIRPQKKGQGLPVLCGGD